MVSIICMLVCLTYMKTLSQIWKSARETKEQSGLLGLSPIETAGLGH